jgi:hypothetical protein
MSKRFLTTTFSPAMLELGTVATVREISLDEAKGLLVDGFVSAVGHEVTALILSAVLDTRIEFARVNLSLSARDCVVCVIPSFRADVAREFTSEEVEAAGLRCFVVEVN